MEYLSQVYSLSSLFIQDYPISTYPELMYKQGRPYACLLIDTHYDYFICVPFRSSISHNNAFIFKKSQRSKKSRSGLDYSKIVIIDNVNYIDSKNIPVVDQDEYKEMMSNIERIVKDATVYVETYVDHCNGSKQIHQRAFSRRYRLSTLKYFHDILGIKENESEE